MSKSLNELNKACLPNTCEYVASYHDRGDFLVQIAWPLKWSETGIPPEDDLFPPQTLFVVDGNAYFYTAVDITRRQEYLRNARTVVVGIGYPNNNAVYDYRRGPDLTPASPDGTYEMPLDKNGNPRTDISFGKAAEFLDFIQNDIMEYLYGTLLTAPTLKNGRKALFGHSYGGIFSLYTLFARPDLFDTVIAASPIIWWNYNFLTKDLESSFRSQGGSKESKPSLFLTYGFCHDELSQEENESEEAYKKRYASADDTKTKSCALEMAERLRESGKLSKVITKQFPDDDHGSTSVTSLQMAIMKFLRLEI